MLNKGRRKGQQGLATIEAACLMMIFVIFIGYALGFFGVIHTGILHSISARTYAFETFRHRANLVYFRSNNTDTPNHFQKHGVRTHAINDINAPAGVFFATEQNITYGMTLETVGRDPEHHNRMIYQIDSRQRNQAVSVNPVWIMISYGICIDAACGSG